VSRLYNVHVRRAEVSRLYLSEETRGKKAEPILRAEVSRLYMSEELR
jgi:hypothetical protein